MTDDEIQVELAAIEQTANTVAGYATNPEIEDLAVLVARLSRLHRLLHSDRTG